MTDDCFIRNDMKPETGESGSIGSGGWGGGGGRSGGSGSGGGWDGNDWGWGGGSSDDSGSGIDWGWWRNGSGGAPFLRMSERGALRMENGRLLAGKQSCSFPALLGYFEDYPDRDKEAEDYKASLLDHRDCVLCSLSDSERQFSFHPKLNVPDPEEPLYKNLRFACDIAWNPGMFSIRVRWQSGHGEYSALNRMRFVVYGVDLGWMQIPVSDWLPVAIVRITNGYQVYVNNLKGRLSGNLKYLEK